VNQRAEGNVQFDRRDVGSRRRVGKVEDVDGQFTIDREHPAADAATEQGSKAQSRIQIVAGIALVGMDAQKRQG
jgi:hypothetical protein